MQRPHNSPLPDAEGARGSGNLIVSAAFIALATGALQADEQVSTMPPAQAASGYDNDASAEPQSVPAYSAPQEAGFSWSRNDNVWPTDTGAQETVAPEAYEPPLVPDIAVPGTVPQDVVQPQTMTPQTDAANGDAAVSESSGSDADSGTNEDDEDAGDHEDGDY
jgi:hypothetical protein